MYRGTTGSCPFLRRLAKWIADNLTVENAILFLKNATDFFGRNALQVAAGRGNEEVMAALQSG
jgi:hypothetical protein